MSKHIRVTKVIVIMDWLEISLTADVAFNAPTPRGLETTIKLPSAVLALLICAIHGAETSPSAAMPLHERPEWSALRSCTSSTVTTDPDSL